MKKLLFLLILWLLPLIGFATINEYKTDVYFANGILTKKKDAIANTALLEKYIKKKLFNNNENEMYKKIGKVDYAYNDTFESKYQNILEGGPDLMESLYQKLGIHGILDDMAHWFDESKISVHQANLEKQVKKYKTSIKNGHKVLVVAHSQGNLFTYEAYRKLDEWMKDYFDAVGVASPGHFSIKDEISISWDNDLVAHLGLYGSQLVYNPVRKVKWKLYDIAHSKNKCN